MQLSTFFVSKNSQNTLNRTFALFTRPPLPVASHTRPLFKKATRGKPPFSTVQPDDDEELLLELEDDEET